MSERKNLNKYKKIEIQFKKAILIKRKKKKLIIRFMMPFDICCLRCRNIIFKGTKLNAIKEKSLNEIYFKFSIFRFYFRCSECKNGITIKTDPKNSFYVPEINCKQFIKKKI